MPKKDLPPTLFVVGELEEFNPPTPVKEATGKAAMEITPFFQKILARSKPDQQVPGARDRQKFGDALDDAEEDDL